MMAAASEAILRVVSAGPGATLQDAGRHGYLRFGVTAAGPMDSLAHATANLAVGNPAGSTAIEVSVSGIEVTAEFASLSVAVAGGEFTLSLDGRPLPPAVVFNLDEGAVLKIRAGRSGSWCYLAVAGRLVVPKVLGSHATHTRTGFGGVDGRAIVAGDRLGIERSTPSKLSLGAIVAPWLDRPATTIRVVLGPQHDYFAEDQIAAFLAGPWSVSIKGDRMAYFLDGPQLTHARGYNIVSDGIALGRSRCRETAVRSFLWPIVNRPVVIQKSPPSLVPISADWPRRGREPGSGSKRCRSRRRLRCVARRLPCWCAASSPSPWCARTLALNFCSASI
jgi:biotin-dependent carboxylase-like uncharacterized protein